MLTKNNLIIGYGGHSFSVINSMIDAGMMINFYSDKIEKISNPYNLTYFGDEDDPQFKGWDQGFNYVLGIGNNKIRQNKGLKVLNKNESLINIIHPCSYISTNSVIGCGIFISSGVHLNTLSSVGNFVILNTGSVIEHECILGSGSSIGPGAVLCGGVRVGERVFIGANSVIKEGIKVGDDSIIGAGSVVINDVEPNSTIVGNPGKRIK